MSQLKKAAKVSNGLINVPDIRIEYRGYIIKPKRDFGGSPFYVNGNQYSRGYVVTDGSCNVMPGATWSESIIGAKALIDCLIESKETGRDFWDILRETQGLTEWEEV